jgi:putative inorganic carbon (HCO3(-)) transporter
MMELPVSIVFLIPLLVAWLIYWLKSHRLGSSAPLDLPILGLLIIASLGIVFAPFKDLFLPKLSGLIIGISVYSIIGAFFRYRQRLPWMIFFLVLMCFIVAVLGLVGTDWPIGNHALFDRIYARLPALVSKLGVEKINKNTIGGVLTFFPPLLLSLLWDKGAFGRLKSHYAKLAAFPEFVYKGLLFLCFALSLGVLFLTQSRGAWLGCAAGIYLLLILKEKRFLWLLLPLGIGFLLIFFLRADGNLLQMFSLLDTIQEATLPGRMEIWSKALIILRDFPLTGIGLGAFGEAYRLYFASIVLPSAADVVFHAHNTLLSVAVEVGLPGVLIYSTVLGGFGAMSWKALKYVRTINRVLALGLACGVVAFLVFGLFDAFTLGRNLEIVFWVFLGCASALYVHDHCLSSSELSYPAYQDKDQTSGKDQVKTKQA